MKDAGSSANHSLRSLLANIYCAVLSFVLGLITAKLLGVESFGVLAVLLASGSVVVSFADTRIADTCTALFVSRSVESSGDSSYRLDVVKFCLAVVAATTLVIYGASLAVIPAVSSFLGIAGVDFFEISLVAAGTALQYLQNYGNYFIRLGRQLDTYWKVRCIAQTTYFCVLFGLFVPAPSLGSYIPAFFFAALSGCGVTLVASHLALARSLSASPWEGSIYRGARHYWGEWKAIFSGNVLGYVKLLHRGGDLLLVAFFSDARVVGIYRLARSLTDQFYLLYDSLNVVHFQELLENLNQRSLERFSRLQRRLHGLGLIVTILGIAGQLIVLPLLVENFLGSGFQGLEVAAAILTVPVYFVIGIHLWIWPLTIFHSMIASFTIIAAIGAIVQVAIAAVFFWMQPESLIAGPLSYLSYYLFVYPVFYLAVRSRGLQKNPA